MSRQILEQRGLVEELHAKPEAVVTVKVAFVVQRCGREVVGGAESLCLQIAAQMSKFWEIEVLATCAVDYMTWANYYAPGCDQLDEVTIRRFEVDFERNSSDFDQLSVQLAANPAGASIEVQKDWMRAQGPISTSLFQFIQNNVDNYDAFVFFGYLYATTYFGLPLVATKAWLAPLGHDEWPIYLAMWDLLFSRPKGFIFQTEEERDFLRRRFPHLSLRGPVVGIGIAPPAIETGQFREKYQLSSPFLLYVGRIDGAKGCEELFAFFLRFLRETNSSYKLVLLGREVLPVPFHDQILYLGFVEDGEKWAAMASCEWLVVPSPHESLSIVVLETWSVSRPVLVTAKSDVLVAHCRKSNGGLWYESYEEWRYILERTPVETQRALAHQGRDYVRCNYSWQRVEQAYLNLFEPHSSVH